MKLYNECYLFLLILIVNYFFSRNPPVAPRTSQIQYKPGNSDDLKSIYELIDCCVLLYCTVAHKYVMLVADLRDNLAKLPECFKDLKSTEPSEQSCARFSFDDTNVTPANFTENMKATFYKVCILLEPNFGFTKIPFFLFRVVHC